MVQSYRQHGAVRRPGGTSGHEPGSTRREVFHFLADAEPAWPSNCVPLISRSSKRQMPAFAAPAARRGSKSRLIRLSTRHQLPVIDRYTGSCAIAFSGLHDSARLLHPPEYPSVSRPAAEAEGHRGGVPAADALRRHDVVAWQGVAHDRHGPDDRTHPRAAR